MQSRFAGCGKIDYPDAILDKRISVADALGAVDECGAPVVVMAGGEPLLHKELPKIVQVIARKKFAIVCTNALLLEEDRPVRAKFPYFTWSIYLDGDQEMHDKSVCQPGVYDRAVSALKTAKSKGFRVTINCTFFNHADRSASPPSSNTVTKLGVDGITMSPGYNRDQRAPDREALSQPFRHQATFPGHIPARRWGTEMGLQPIDDVPRLPGRQPDVPLHALGQPDATVFGWQRPCYLLGEGYAKTFKELMEETDWDA